MEKENNTKIKVKKQKKYNDTYLYIIIFLIIVIFVETTYILCDKLIFTENKSKEISKENSQTQNFSSKELIEYFKNSNYDFIMVSYDNSDYNAFSIQFYNDNITFLYKSFTDPTSNAFFLYNDSDINDEYINILDESKIKDIQQFNSYENWLEENNIEKEKLLEMLYYYYQNNPNEVIHIDS